MLFVFDLDGKICFDGQNIEPEITKYIQLIKEKNEVIFASARPIRDMLPLVSKDFPDTKLIGGNGSILFIDGEINVVKFIKEKAYHAIKNIIQKYKLDFVIDGSFNYSSRKNSNNKIFKQVDPDNLAKRVSLEDITTPIKIILIDVKKSDYEEICTTLNLYSQYLSINYHEKEQNIDITASGINKYSTLKGLISEQEYIAYGNDINDHELLKNSQISHYVVDKENNHDFKFDHILQGKIDVIESIKNYV